MKMSRFVQWLAAILFLCFAVNGILFVLHIHGCNPFIVVTDYHFQKQTERYYQGVGISSVSADGNNNRSSTNPNGTIVYPRNYTFVINHPDYCQTQPELLMVVCTSVSNSKQRRAIRETWGSYVNDAKHKTKLVFLFGRSDDKNLEKAIRNESQQYGDIIQADFHDSYRNLSIKSVAMLKWATTYCSSAKYVLKVDDDMYINVPNLLASLRKQTLEKFVMGRIIDNAQPVQNKTSKWYTPLTSIPFKVYPRYTSGSAYSMSIRAAADLYAASQQIDLFWLEDIYITGLCAKKAGIKILNDNGFTFLRRKASGCIFKSSISGHRYSTTDIYKIHKELYTSPPPKC